MAKNAAKKSKPMAQVEAEHATIADRLERVEYQLSLLVESMTKVADPPELKKKGLKSQAKSDAARGLRARIGRAARRNGMTMQEWIRKYGEVDKLPGD